MAGDGRAADDLSERETDVFELSGRGRTNAQIASELGLTFATAKWYVSQVISKCGVSSREEVASLWRSERGIRASSSRYLRALPWVATLKFAGAATFAALAIGLVAVTVSVRRGDSAGTPTGVASPTPTVGPLLTDAAAIRVDVDGVRQLDGTRTAILYRIRAPQSAFTEMLGAPRIINPDGSVALPQSYGAVDPSAKISAGLPTGQLQAVYTSADILPGSLVRFGPFFVADSSGFTLPLTGAELSSGFDTAIAGEPFHVSAQSVGGMTMITFRNVAPDATVMVTNPASREVVTVDGKAVDVVHGSGNFAKDASYDVNANQSTIALQGDLAPRAQVVITGSSIGRVVRGNWDFALK